jgi:hypothetical protein
MVETCWVSSSSTSATVHDEPWPLLRLLSIGPDPVGYGFIK